MCKTQVVVSFFSVLSAVAAASLLLIPVSSASAATEESVVGVSLREYHVIPYRSSVPSGNVRFNITNNGMDAHNLTLRGPSGFKPRKTPKIAPHDTYTLTANLTRRGRYRLVCTIGEHEESGMSAAFKVR